MKKLLIRSIPLTAIGVAASLFISAPAFAKRKKRHRNLNVASAESTNRRPTAVDPEEPLRADVIEAILDRAQKPKSKKGVKRPGNKSASNLNLAYQAISSGNFAEARRLAKLAEGDELFSDYSHWIQASAFQSEAASSLAENKKKEATPLAKQAYTHFQSVFLASPYSPLVHLAPRQAGISELMWAQSLDAGRDAVKHFENAFERLTNLSASIEIQHQNVVAYAAACHSYHSTYCDIWLSKLAPSLPRGSEEAKSVRKYFPEAFERTKNPAQAQRATQPYKAPDLDSAAFDEAMLLVRSQKWHDVSTQLQKFLDEFPRSALRYRARFWLAQALYKDGKKDESKKVFEETQKDSPLTFYGLISAIAAGDEIDGSISQEPPMAAQRDALMSADDSYRLNRAELFLAEGANELASLELKDIHARPTLSSPFLMYLSILNFRAQNFPTEFVLLSELVQRSYPGISSDYGLKLIFPVVHFDIIKKYAKQNDLDPILVLSLIKQESAFDVRAFSGSGASGLMQLMPFTAVETVPGITRAQLAEADANIAAGTKYLAKLMNRYKGNAVLGLASYNAGPNAVERWVNESGSKADMIDFIESITYKETREYVSSIIRNYYWYSKLLDREQPQSLVYFWNHYKNIGKDAGLPEPKPTSVKKTHLALTPSPMPIPSEQPSETPIILPSPSPSPVVGPSSVPSAEPSSVVTPIAAPTSTTSAIPSAQPDGGPTIAPAPSSSPLLKMGPVAPIYGPIPDAVKPENNALPTEPARAL